MSSVPPLPFTAPRRAQISWCLFDWANSTFPTVIVTFVFAAYFAKAVAANPTEGTTLWGTALSLCGLAIAILGPVIGAIADKRGARKPWLAGFTLLCIFCSSMLWFTQPSTDWVIWGLFYFALGNFAFEVGMVFYNAMLPTLVPPARVGRLSGWGWGLGYAGGLCCLALTLVVFVQPETPFFGLDKDSAEHIRIVGPLVAVWFALFSIPLFLFVPDKKSTGISVFRAGLGGLIELRATLRKLPRNKPLLRFLLARVLYIDGLNTLFAFGGIYAAGTFGMTVDEIILFGIALNVTAGLGAVSFAWIDDWIGSKRTIMIALVGLVIVGTPILFITSKTAFWVPALALGIFMGPAQAASRSLMARLAPPDQVTEMFGLFALSGKVTAFLGPAVLAYVTAVFASQRAGMATVIVFMAAGALILLTVKEPGPDSRSG
jgi:UMF1 family MFS transporter